MHERERRSFGLILFLLAMFLVSLCMAGLNGTWLLAQGYSHYVQELLATHQTTADGRLAADWAVKLSPFNHSQHVLRAWMYQLDGQNDPALEDFRLSLALAPADPFVWQSYIHFKLEQSQFDNDLLQALQHVQQLAPYSYALRRENAVLGILYWDWGGR